MVNLRDSEGRNWNVQIGGNPLKPISIELDGEIIESGNISFFSDSRPNRIIIKKGNIQKVAFCAKVGDKWWIHLDGNVSIIEVIEPGISDSGNNEGAFTAPMPGKVLEVLIPEGAKVSEGQPLMVLEAMKMEHRILADKQGTVTAIHFSQGDQVDAGSVLLDLETD